MKKLVLLGVMLAGYGSPVPAATISFVAPLTASGPFDVTVLAQDLFTGRDTLTDIIISYGFNVSISDPSVLALLGVTSGPLFDPAGTAPGTDVFASAFGQNGFGVEPGAAEPLTLATLHFNVIGAGHADITFSTDLSNLFQGLQFFNAPFQESIAGIVPLDATVPEPATLVLSGVGLLGVVILRRRLRSIQG